MAACSFPYLEKYTNAEDWTGGFMGRWAVMLGQRTRTVPFPVPYRVGHEHLVEHVFARASAETAGWCEGLDKEAMDLWDEWYTTVSNRDLPPIIAGTRVRAPTIALKAALLFGWDYGPATASDAAPWKMSVRELWPAIQFAELHLRSVIALSARICEHSDARLRRDILDALTEAGGLASLGTIITRLKVRKRMVEEMCQSLLEEQLIERARLPDGAPAYAMRGFGAVPS